MCIIMFSSLVSSFQSQRDELQDNGGILVTMGEGYMWEEENIQSALSNCGVPSLEPRYEGLDQPTKYPQWYRHCPNKTRIHGHCPLYTAGLREKLARIHKRHSISLMSKSTNTFRRTSCRRTRHAAAFTDSTDLTPVIYTPGIHPPTGHQDI